MAWPAIVIVVHTRIRPSGLDIALKQLQPGSGSVIRSLQSTEGMQVVLLWSWRIIPIRVQGRRFSYNVVSNLRICVCRARRRKRVEIAQSANSVSYVVE